MVGRWFIKFSRGFLMLAALFSGIDYVSGGHNYVLSLLVSFPIVTMMTLAFEIQWQAMRREPKTAWIAETKVFYPVAAVLSLLLFFLFYRWSLDFSLWTTWLSGLSPFLFAFVYCDRKMSHL